MRGSEKKLFNIKIFFIEFEDYLGGIGFLFNYLKFNHIYFIDYQYLLLSLIIFLIQVPVENINELN